MKGNHAMKYELSIISGAVFKDLFEFGLQRGSQDASITTQDYEGFQKMKTDVQFTRKYSKKSSLKPKVTKKVLKPSIFHFIKSAVLDTPSICYESVLVTETKFPF